MILVTGATGKFGGSVAQYLIGKSIPFRAAAKSPEGLQKNYEGKAELVAFDWDRPETFAAALINIHTVSIVPPPVFGDDFHITLAPFINAAYRAGVKHIVLTSALYSDQPDSIFFGTEALVRNSGMDFTIIRPSFIFQNFLSQFLQSVRDGIIVAPSENGRTSYVDVRNVGEAIGVVLEDPASHKGRVYSITGPEALTHKEMATIFSAVLNKEVVHYSPTPEAFKERLVAMKMPGFLTEFLAELYGTIAKGQWRHVSKDYLLLTSKLPNSFKHFVKEYSDVFLAANLQDLWTGN